MVIFLSFFLFLGGFIYGMYLLRSGLFDLSADFLKKWQIKRMDQPWKCMLMGTIITAILQNMFAVWVITSRLVATRLLTFYQSIGIILGAYVGKTITAEIMTLNLQASVIPMVLMGAILYFIKIKNFDNIGYVLIGWSLVFGSLWGFEITASLMKESDDMHDFFLTLDQSHLYALLVGIIFTAISQSSTAAIGLTMSFLSAEMMNLATGVAIILGANIGTCIIMLLATISSRKEARLTALSYTWLNIFCIALIYPLIHLFVTIGMNVSSHPDIQLAHIIVIFHVIVSLIVLPFVQPFGTFISTIHHYKINK